MKKENKDVESFSLVFYKDKKLGITTVVLNFRDFEVTETGETPIKALEQLLEGMQIYSEEEEKVMLRILKNIANTIQKHL